MPEIGASKKEVHLPKEALRRLADRRRASDLARNSARVSELLRPTASMGEMEEGIKLLHRMKANA